MKLKEFKEGDKVMCVYTNSNNYTGICYGKVVRKSITGYIIQSDDGECNLVYTPEMVDFDAWRWSQIKTFYDERTKLLQQADEKLQMIKTKLYNSEGVK